MKKSASWIPIIIFLGFLFTSCNDQNQDKNKITKDKIAAAEEDLALEFTNTERDSLLENVRELESYYQNLRKYNLSNNVYPAILFNPLPPGFTPNADTIQIAWTIPLDVDLLSNKSELAFYPVYKLASLIKSGKISSMELTTIYLERLRKYGDTLHCVINITEDLAMQQARQADQDLSNGIYKGPLHGIPYGVKDLLAVKGYKTTWGAMPFKDQVIDETATIIKKLEDAGAVLIAKLSMGALAMGDVWYDGISRNPWDLNQGSSGSSAGSASATAAGLVGFSIGTETYGSIISPSTRCGVTGLRPTFGRISRDNAMALSWTMDKIGPICRSAYGCAMVFDVIRGADPADPSTINAAFDFNPERNIKNLKIAYLKNLFESDYHGKENDSITLSKIRDLGIDLIPVDFEIDLPVEEMIIILLAEAAAAFDELTRTNQDDLLVAQHKGAWPNIFRYSRFIPAVEYIQASRLRTLLIKQMNDFLSEYDVVITPSFGGDQLLATNLSGQPCVVILNGFDQYGHSTSISFIGNLFDEASLLEFARFIQDNSPWEDKHPDFFQ